MTTEQKDLIEFEVLDIVRQIKALQHFCPVCEAKRQDLIAKSPEPEFMMKVCKACSDRLNFIFVHFRKHGIDVDYEPIADDELEDQELVDEMKLDDVQKRTEA